MRQTKQRIVILGGGFGGMYCALELDKALQRGLEAEVTLVNKENFFLFTPMLHEVAASDLDVLAQNMIASMNGGQKKPFRFKQLGALAAIGRRTGVAQMFGFQFSGFLAWWMWRTIYLSKLPRFEKKFRVALDWTLDLIFSKNLVQFQTLRTKGISHAEIESRRLEAAIV